MDKKYDVIVVGGGTAGVIAAVQAGREGVKTLLVEKSEILSGTIVNAGVDYPGLFHAWKKQIISGIGWELVCKSMNEEKRPYPDFSIQEQIPHWREQLRINGAYYSLICEEALNDAGVDVLYGAICASIVEGENNKTVTICTKEGLINFETEILIDCTGDANAVSLAGYEVLCEEEWQPATYSCELSGYDANELDYEKIGIEFNKEVAKGNIKFSDISWNTEEFNPQWLKNYGRNANHIYVDGITGKTSQEKSIINKQGRLAILKLLRFCRRQEGLENIRLEGICAECGIRETVRIKGKSSVTKENYISGKRYGDDICYTFYPIDLHTKTDRGLSKIYLEEGIVPTIPMGALLPKESRNLIVAGRCISSDRAANSAVRVQATCMATGQAAGAMAVLAVKNGKEVSELDINEVYAVLRKHHAIIPD